VFLVPEVSYDWSRENVLSRKTAALYWPLVQDRRIACAVADHRWESDERSAA
jgi:hypothetical protein